MLFSSGLPFDLGGQRGWDITLWRAIGTEAIFFSDAIPEQPTEVGVAFGGSGFVCGFNAAKVSPGTNLAPGAGDVFCIFYCRTFFSGIEPFVLVALRLELHSFPAMSSFLPVTMSGV